MRILFVCDTLPFPATDGLKLPTSKFIEYFSKFGDVDILTFEPNKNPSPNYINETFYANLKKESKEEPSNYWLRVAAIFKDFSGNRPIFADYKLNSSSTVQSLDFNKYDFIWISPAKCFCFVSYLREVVGYEKKIILGLNDVLTGMYIDSLKELISGRFGFDKFRLLRLFRIYGIRRWEIKIYDKVDYIHLQTRAEKNKVKKYLSDSLISKCLVLPNGHNAEPKIIRNSRNFDSRLDKKSVLFMTHLDGNRAKESWWFFKKVWPEVLQKFPNVELKVVGAPPKEVSASDEIYFSNNNIKIVGFVDHLSDAFEGSELMVVPTIHSTGLINRIFDGVAFGVPMVTTNQVHDCMADFNLKGSYLVSGSRKELVDNIVLLLSNDDLRYRLAMNSRKLSEELPRWPTVDKDLYDTIK